VFVNTLVVLKAFEAYRLPVTVTGPVTVAVFATVRVFVNTLVVLKAFEAYKLPVIPRVGPPVTGVNPPTPRNCAAVTLPDATIFVV